MQEFPLQALQGKFFSLQTYAAEQTLKSVGPWSKISKPPVVVCFSAHRLRNCVTSLYHGKTMDPVLQHGAGAYSAERIMCILYCTCTCTYCISCTLCMLPIVPIKC